MNYNANDIISLSAGRAFREKIGMYLSADRQEAINLGLRELIVNVQDEYEVYKPKNPFCKIESSAGHFSPSRLSIAPSMDGSSINLRKSIIDLVVFSSSFPPLKRSNAKNVSIVPVRK